MIITCTFVLEANSWLRSNTFRKSERMIKKYHIIIKNVKTKFYRLITCLNMRTVHFTEKLYTSRAVVPTTKITQTFYDINRSLL